MDRSPLNPVVVLGATGSIGTQTLEVADALDTPVVAIAARRASPQLLSIAKKRPEVEVYVADPRGDGAGFDEELADRVHYGPGAISELAATPGVTVVNGIVGAAGLRASLAALHGGNRLALANKESMVAGGPLMRRALATEGAEIIPVDSEHSAIHQCMVGEERQTVRRLILTASGGPLLGADATRLTTVTVDEALSHPTWQMGSRITIDSATLANKAFEVIEAHYLFDIPYDHIDVVVHPQSIVHSFVEFTDGVVKAEVGFPDMRKPIQYAITAPDRVDTGREALDLVGTDLTFIAPDTKTFRCLDLGYSAGRTGGTATAVMNAADEVAVAAFLSGRIRFDQIAAVIEHALTEHEPVEPADVTDVEAADHEARSHAGELIARL